MKTRLLLFASLIFLFVSWVQPVPAQQRDNPSSADSWS